MVTTLLRCVMSCIMSLLVLCFYYVGTLLLQMSLRRCLKGDGSGVIVCDAGGELLIPFPWALVFAFTDPRISLGRTTSTGIAPPRSAYLTTDQVSPTSIRKEPVGVAVSRLRIC